MRLLWIPELTSRIYSEFLIPYWGLRPPIGGVASFVSPKPTVIAVVRLCISRFQASGVLRIDKSIMMILKGSPWSEPRDSAIWIYWF
jgi:hypothetical protein